MKKKLKNAVDLLDMLYYYSHINIEDQIQHLKKTGENDEELAFFINLKTDIENTISENCDCDDCKEKQSSNNVISLN